MKKTPLDVASDAARGTCQKPLKSKQKKDVETSCASRPDSTERPIPPQHRPTRRDSCPACPRRRQCPYHIYTCTQRRFPFPSPIAPSSRLLPSSSSDPPWCSRERESLVAVVQERWQDSVGSWCADIQSLGNSGYPWEPEELQRLESEWVRHPTECMSTCW